MARIERLEVPSTCEARTAKARDRITSTYPRMRTRAVATLPREICRDVVPTRNPEAEETKPNDRPGTPSDQRAQEFSSARRFAFELPQIIVAEVRVLSFPLPRVL